MNTVRGNVPGRPLGFAHRGARAECPDNTLVGFARALELGALGLESDVWLTADGVPVLDHDGIVRREQGRVPIAAIRRDDLPAHIPTLAELYDTCGSAFDLSLDVKDPAAAGPSVEAAALAGATGRLWLCGSGALLPRWRTLSEQVRIVDSTKLAEVPEGLAARAGALSAVGVDAINLRWPAWTGARVAEVHGARLLAFAWDAQRAATVRGLVALGIDAVYSDHVGRMLAGLGLRRPSEPGGSGGSEPVQA